MDLLSTQPPRKPRRLLGGRVSARTLGVLAVLGCLGVAFVAGALAYRGGLASAAKRALVGRTPTPTPQCPVAAVEAPVLEILMGDKAYRSLTALREEFLQGGLVMVHESDDFVEAYVQYGEAASPLKAQLRLTGNMVDRIRDAQKWSFRIEVDEPGRVLGMQEFSLHPPWARDYMSEWYYMQALRHEGLIASRYSFVRVRLNGKDLGIYGMEEHPGMPLLENNGRPLAPILRFEQDTFWQEWATFGDEVVTSGGTGSGSFNAAEIRPYDRQAMTDSVLATQALSGTAQTDLARDLAASTALLEAFRLGKLTTHEVFDVPLTARFFALTDLMGAWHTLNWNMMRFYYNPSTGLLEPVGLNGYNDYTGASIRGVGLLGESIEQYPFPRTRELHARFFADLDFARAYAHELERLSDPAWLDAFEAAVADRAREAYSIMYEEAPQASCSTQVFRANAEHIRKVLNPNTKGVQAYFERYEPGEDNGLGATVTLQVANMQKLPVEILALRYKGRSLAAVQGAALVLSGRREAMQYSEVTFFWPEDVVWSEEARTALMLVYHPLGTSAENRHESAVFAWPYSLPDDYVASLAAERPPDLAQFDCLRVEEEARVIHILPGDWTITRTMVIPAGYEVHCGPGTRLHLRDGAGITSASPLRWMGDPDAPIVLDGDGSGRGLLLSGVRGTSLLEYVVLEGLQAPVVNGAPVVGTVTLFESPSRWFGCQVLHPQGQAALHAVNTSVVLTEMLIQDAAADGVLLERCAATLENVGMARVAQSGLAARTSTVEINRLTVDQTGGCALSALEGSAVTLQDLLAQDCHVGLASADNGVLDATGVVLRRCAWGLAAFQAQAAWGAAELAVTGITLEDVGRDVICEQGSNLTVDGEARDAIDQNVAALVGGQDS